MEYELIIATDLTKINPQEIKFNKVELQAELSESLDKYRGMIVTADTIPEAKEVRAKVNKVATAINDEKKRVKKIMTEPVTRFENDVKELLAMCESVSSAIDTQIKAFEEQVKAEKKADLQSTFNAATANIAEYASFDEVFDPRWLNATFGVGDAERAIDQFAERRKMDVDALEQIEAEPTVKAMLVSRYKSTKSLSDVLRLKKEIEDRAKLEAERAAAIEAAKQAKIDAPVVSPPVVAPVPVIPPYSAQQAASNEVTCITYRIYATEGKMAQLEAYMTANSISFEEVF